MMQNENTDMEHSPPPTTSEELFKRDLKRKFTDQKTVEAKRAKSELSIEI